MRELHGLFLDSKKRKLEVSEEPTPPKRPRRESIIKRIGNFKVFQFAQDKWNALWRKGYTIPFEFVVSMLSGDSDLLASYLSQKSMLALAATSKSLFNSLCPIISRIFVFRLSTKTPNIFRYYSPRKLICYDNASALPCLDKVPFTSNITHLTLGPSFNKPPVHLPSNITHLTFTGSFNCAVTEVLPITVTHLSLSKRFNKQVDGLPPNITHLIFGRDFNKSVDNLPPTVTNLKFNTCFNRPVDHLPHKLTHLIFHHTSIFNLPIDQLPASLVLLELGDHFDQRVDSLPQQLCNLTFHSRFNQPLDNLPKNLGSLLIFGPRFCQDTSNLPPGLAVLFLGYHPEQSVDYLPSNLKVLILPSKRPLKNVPDNLTVIILCEEEYDFQYLLDHEGTDYPTIEMGWADWAYWKGWGEIRMDKGGWSIFSWVTTTLLAWKASLWLKKIQEDEEEERKRRERWALGHSWKGAWNWILGWTHLWH